MIVQKLLNIALLGTSWVLYALLGMSVVSIGSMVERWVFFRRHMCQPEELSNRLCDLLLAGDLFGAEQYLAKSRSVEAKMLLPALRWIEGGPEALADAVDSEMARGKKGLERGLTLLGTLGNNAPFIGLFGTVIGVIEAFHQLSAGPNSAAMGNVMSGIAEALVATGVGLFVAIPAVIAYNLLQKRIGEIEANVVSITKQISALLKTRAVQGVAWNKDPERNGETTETMSDNGKRSAESMEAVEVATATTN